MCGIAGLLHPVGQEVSSLCLEAFSRGLARRGPDDAGFLGWDGNGKVSLAETAGAVGNCRLGMVHRRLSILDLTKAGWQPMGSDDENYHLVFNGEVYNFVELRADLERLGHRFHSHSDTEVVLHAYMQWGTQAFERFIGMFACAILDLRKRCLFLARDFFGIKPLYYAGASGGFAFCSDAKLLLELPGVTRQTNPQRLYQYLRFGLTDHSGETLWASISQVPAGHFLEISLDDLRSGCPQRYWQLDLHQPLDISFEAAARELRQLFLDSVRLHLRSDVPVGTCLSGGLDSSAIVMAARHLLGDAPEFHAFSYISNDDKASEEKWMDLVAAKARMLIHKTRPDSQNLVDRLGELVRIQGEPFVGSSVFAQYEVFKLIHQTEIKVVLDGQGADEMLGGYWSFVSARAASLLSRGHLGEAVRLLRNASRMPDACWQNTWAMTLGLFLPPALKSLGLRCLGKDLIPCWMNRDWFLERGVTPSYSAKASQGEHLREQLLHSLECMTLPMLLRYEDRNSMAFSVESRVPFLSPPLVKFIFSLPEEYIIDKQGTRKSVFRAAMRGIVPDEILDRRDKIGFATPERAWFGTQKQWVSDLLRSDAAGRIPALNQKALQRQWDKVCSPDKSFSAHVWRWINLIEWARIFDVRFDA